MEADDNKTDQINQEKQTVKKQPKHKKQGAIIGFFSGLIHYFFGKQDDTIAQTLRTQQKEIIDVALQNKDNPYLFGYATYVALYADQEEKSTYYKNINRVLLLLLIAFAIIMTSMSMTAKIQPFVVGINQNGQVFDLNQTVTNQSVKNLLPKLAANMIQTFVRSAYSVSIDGDVLRDNRSRSLAMTKGGALNTLLQFYKSSNPLEIAKKDVISIAVNYVLPVSAHTFKVGWTATTKDAKSADIVNVQKYTGQFTYAWGMHSTEKLVSKFNPLGFYVNSMSWSKDTVS